MIIRGLRFHLHPRLSHVVHLRRTASERQLRIANLEFRMITALRIRQLALGNHATESHYPITPLKRYSSRLCLHPPTAEFKSLKAEPLNKQSRGEASLIRVISEIPRSASSRSPISYQLSVFPLRPALLKPLSVISHQFSLSR